MQLVLTAENISFLYRDLKALLVEIADRHIQYYQGNVEGWQDALDVVKKPTKASTSE